MNLKLSLNELKYIRSLHQRKFRQKYQNFIAEGTKLAQEALSTPGIQPEAIYALPEWVADHASLCAPFSSVIREISATDLKQISLLTSPNQVFMILKQPTFSLTSESLHRQWSLYLEDIRDPGNMGTILRIADWFGLHYVFCSPTCVEIFNPKVVQASMGAIFRVHCIEKKIEEILSLMPKLPVFGTTLDGESVFRIQHDHCGLIVIGNESHGISHETRKFLTQRITIPAGLGGSAQSLNVAVAAGIVCAILLNKE